MAWHPFALTAAALTSACGSEVPSVEPLLATELIYQDESPDRDASFKVDAAVAPHPDIARAIIVSKQQEIEALDCTVGSTCIYSSNIESRYSGEKLISLTDTTRSFFGGAHPSMEAKDFMYDVQTHEQLKIWDLFGSWPAARVILQREWCDSVRGHSTCPPIEEQAVALSGGRDGINAIWVKTSDYAFGNYAEGPDEAFLGITPELITLVKPEYRPYFTSEVCC
jgi:hypothetical protein